MSAFYELMKEDYFSEAFYFHLNHSKRMEYESKHRADFTSNWVYYHQKEYLDGYDIKDIMQWYDDLLDADIDVDVFRDYQSENEELNEEYRFRMEVVDREIQRMRLLNYR